MNMSLIFHNFNHLRKYARVNPLAVDIARLNRALGIAQSVRLQGDDAEYHPTAQTCDCKDIEFRRARNRKNQQGEHYEGPCKHMLAQMLLEDEEKDEAPMK